MSVFYAEGAVLISTHAVYIGKDVILTSYQKDDKVNEEHVDSTVVEDVRVSGDLAVARGTDTGVTTPRGGGTPDRYIVKWLMAFARQPDGTWKCIDEMWRD
jgi:ketosteroid isomerase-like protein